MNTTPTPTQKEIYDIVRRMHDKKGMSSPEIFYGSDKIHKKEVDDMIEKSDTINNTTAINLENVSFELVKVTKKLDHIIVRMDDTDKIEILENILKSLQNKVVDINDIIYN